MSKNQVISVAEKMLLWNINRLGNYDLFMRKPFLGALYQKVTFKVTNSYVSS